MKPIDGEAVAKLAASLLIDAVGMASLPLGITEIADTLYAPLSAALVWGLYGNAAFAAVALVEEGMVGTDVIPTATLAWAYTYLK